MASKAGAELPGTIFKKCDMALHRPQSRAACRAGTCQHTCAKPGQCRHAWTLRYWAGNRQRELSFGDELDPAGRPRHGSGRKLAQDAQLKIAHDKRAQVFIDPKLGGVAFTAECERWIGRLAGVQATKVQYRSVLNAHVGRVFDGRSLASVAQARDEVADLLSVRMGGLSLNRRMLARSLVTGVLDEAVTAGKITAHRCGGIALGDNGVSRKRDDFLYPSHAQLDALAGGMKDGLTVWLMRGCGLRIQEAFAVQKSCFRENGTVLRVYEQASKDGRGCNALKHRKAGEYRDIPVPGYLWEMVKDLPDGYLFMRDGRLPVYGSYLRSFTRQAAGAGIPGGFTPHSLRHVFASALLARLVPITDVAAWLGHKDINVTYAIYGHLVPSSLGRALKVLDAEYQEWRDADTGTGTPEG
jgi:integrase